MADYYNPPQAPVTTYVKGGQVQTVAQLLAAYPPSAAFMGMYARVTNLYGSVDDILRCRFDGSAYRWVPQRDSFAGIDTTTTGTIPILPLLTPPVLDLTGTLTGNITPTLSEVNAYVGQSQLIRSRGVLGLFGITIAGLVGGGTLALLAGGDRTLVYTPQGWKG